MKAYIWFALVHLFGHRQESCPHANLSEPTVPGKGPEETVTATTSTTHDRAAAIQARP